MPRPATIALDGPVAAGKTSVGRLLANRLGYQFLDTGTMYRTVAWEALRLGVDPSDGLALTALVRRIKIELLYSNTDKETVLVDGRDVTAELRRPEVEQAVSLVAQFPGVREALVAQQRALAKGNPMVMVGRDIGTVVLPDAPLKLFLRASLQERARRRFLEFQSMGRVVTYEEVLGDLERRDRLDSQRAASPLKPARDAVVIETDGIGVAGVIDHILSLMDP